MKRHRSNRSGFGMPGIALHETMIILFLVSPLLWTRLEPNEYTGGRSRDTHMQTERNTSAIATMLGEFRTGLSDVLYIKTERYLDSGIAYQPHFEDAALAADKHATEGDGDDSSHAGTPTLISSPDKDYRGIIGALQREVKPWADPSMGHKHSDGRELLPWFKLMTVSDSHYIRGYTVGGYWLSLHDQSEAVQFLRDGLKSNPSSFQLHLVLSQILLKVEQDVLDEDTESSDALSKIH
jgi:hypothetical protein